MAPMFLYGSFPTGIPSKRLMSASCLTVRWERSARYLVRYRSSKERVHVPGQKLMFDLLGFGVETMHIFATKNRSSCSHIRILPTHDVTNPSSKGSGAFKRALALIYLFSTLFG